MNWKDWAEPLYKPEYQPQKLRYAKYLDMYKDRGDVLDFGDLVNPPIKSFTIWHTPKRFRLTGFLSGKPIVTKVFWKLNTK